MENFQFTRPDAHAKRRKHLYKIGVTFVFLLVSVLMIAPVSAEEYTILSEQQVSLSTGKLSPVYTITLQCTGVVKLTSNNGTKYNLYAKKRTDYGSCPYASSIISNYDKVAYGNNGITTMNLGPGVWCIIVYGYSGSGTYSFHVTSNCQQPTPTRTPTPYPTSNPGPCDVYKTNTQQGALNQGQAAVYRYSIPSDGRSKIDWSMTSTGSCSGSDTPVIIASVDAAQNQADACIGSSTFDLYIFKDCNPKTSRCTTNYYSYGPNSYAAINSPSIGSIYYVMVYARSGSGTFNLKMNSYKCSGGDTPIIAASSGGTSQISASSQDASTVSAPEVPAPTAEFVQSGDE